MPAASSSRTLTVPNALSLLRLACIPVFLLLVASGADVWAAVLFVGLAATDWMDGYLARRLDQESRLGAVLDPVVDRLAILAAFGALVVQGLLPWWFLAAVFVRDTLLWGLLPVLRRHGIEKLSVHLVGKVATACLLAAVPLLLVGDGERAFSDAWGTAGWVVAWSGLVAAWTAGLLYVRTAVRLATRREEVLVP